MCCASARVCGCGENGRDYFGYIGCCCLCTDTRVHATQWLSGVAAERRPCVCMKNGRDYFCTMSALRAHGCATRQRLHATQWCGEKVSVRRVCVHAWILRPFCTNINVLVKCVFASILGVHRNGRDYNFYNLYRFWPLATGALRGCGQTGRYCSRVQDPL